MELRSMLRTVLGLTHASCPIGNGSSFPGIKQPEHKPDHSSPHSAKAKNEQTNFMSPACPCGRKMFTIF